MTDASHINKTKTLQGTQFQVHCKALTFIKCKVRRFNFSNGALPSTGVQEHKIGQVVHERGRTLSMGRTRMIGQTRCLLAFRNDIKHI